jgi:hypothetical protein
MKFTVELSNQQIHDIVVKELQYYYGVEKETGLDGRGMNVEPDQKLLDAIETVLDYYMSASEFERWKNIR